MARMHRTIQRRLSVHRPASSDAERSARARGCLGRHSGVWSVGGNFLQAVNSPRTPLVGWSPRSKDGSRPVCLAVSATPSEATLLRPISSLQRDTVSRTEQSCRRCRSPAPSHCHTPRSKGRYGPQNTSFRWHAAKLRTDRKLTRLRATRGEPLTRSKRAAHSPPAPEVAGHQDSMIVGDRDRSEVERLVVQ
jgi:hypothetical protein